MNKILLFILSCLMLTVSGCVTTRGLVSLNSPTETNSTQAEKYTVVIKTVNDLRQFEDKPKKPNIPSLKGGLSKATAEEKAKAIARKRNAYGKALGDILLREGTVASVIEQRAISAFQQSGYKVLPATNQNITQADFVYTINVDKFWSWVELGLLAAKLNTEIKTVFVNEKDSSKSFNVEVSKVNSLQMVTGSMWIRNTNQALDAFDDKLLDQIQKH